MPNLIQRLVCPVLLFAAWQHAAVAQLPTADVVRLNPPAARAGETVNVGLYGSNLEDLSELRFTHAGITAQRVMQPPAEFFPEPRPSGSSFSVTVAKDVPPGIYEARAVSYFGLSTSRPFVVAPQNANEVAETGDHSTPDKAMPIELNSVVNGSVPSRGIDWYRFQAKAGQRVLLEIHAERIDSRMDGQLIVTDLAGREIARNRDRYGRDPFLEVSPERDTEFLLAVSDILYRGGNEHFYRLSISDRPHIDFVFPPAGQAGSKATYTIYGRNLPGGSPSNISLNGQPLESVQADIELPATSSTPTGHHPGEPRQGLLRGFDYTYENSNAVRIGFSAAPVVVENSDQALQTISVPSEVAGRFDAANDEDVFRFLTKKGKTYCLEVIADRMASTVDPWIIVHRVTQAADGTQTLTQVAENDDLPTFFSVHGKESINADTNDAAVSFRSTEGGEYRVTIINQFGDGGPTHLYRLAVREPTPDFDLIATTERPLPTGRTGYSVTPHLRKNAKWGLRIVAPRQDQFEGDIVVTAEDLPPGVSARPLTLSGKTDHGILVLSAAADAKSWSGDIRIVGKTQVGDRQLVREARFASLVWGHIFADSIRVRSRLTQHVPLSVNGFEAAPVIIAPAEDKEWTVEVGQKLELPIKVTNHSRKGTLTVEPFELFGMLRSPPTVNVAQDATEATLTIPFTPNGNFQVKPGRYQFALLGTGIAKYRRNMPASQRANAEKQRIETLAAMLQTEVKQAQAQAAEAKQGLDLAKQKAATATPDLKAALDQAVIKAQAAFAAADKAAKQAATKAKRLEGVRKKFVAAAQSAEKTATAKDSKFAAWSNLITVNVTEPVKK